MALFQPARRERLRLRAAIHGPSGAGKTLTSLILARALSPDGRFAVIDTELKAEEYACDTCPDGSCYCPRRFQFGHFAPLDADPEQLPIAMAEAADAGYGSLVIDSWSLYWAGQGGALDYVDRQGGDKRQGWSKYRPVENGIRAAMLSYPGHVIATMRVKTVHLSEADARGRAQVRRLGQEPVQRDTAEYDFSVVGRMDEDHSITFTKSTCEALQDATFHKPGLDLAETLREWLGQGIAPAPDVLAFRDKVLDAPEESDLRKLWAEAHGRNWLGAHVIDNHGDAVTLADLIRRRKDEVRPVRLANALTEAAA